MTLTLDTVLVGLALVFGLLEVFNVPSRAKWAGLGVVCLATALLF